MHTNTVECANSIVKKRSKREGGVLDRKAARREDRVQAYAEQGSGSLKCNGGDALLRVLEIFKRPLRLRICIVSAFLVQSCQCLHIF